MTALSAFVLACALKATVILAMAWVVCAIGRRSSSALRHRVWALSILCALWLPLLQLLLSRAPEAAVYGGAPAWTSVPFLPGASSLAGAGYSFTVRAGSGTLWRVPWGASLLWLWIAGAAITGLRLASGMLGLLRISRRARHCRDARMLSAMVRCARRMEVERPVRLRVTTAHAMPCTWGFFRPVVLLPATCLEWPDARRDIVLTHEMAHIQRLDWPLGVLAEAVRALYWFHPLAWLAIRNLRRESEHACDDAVLAAGQDSACYAGELLHLVRGAQSPSRYLSTALAVARPSNLTRRITAMLDPTLNRRRPTRRATLVSTAFTVLLLVPIAALRAPAQNTAGHLSGSIVDPRGAAVVSATIILSNAATHYRDMTATDASGNFRFEALPAGDYDMRVLKPGFAELTRPVVLNTGEDQVLKLALAMGAVLEHVQVSPSTPAGVPQAQTMAPKRIPVGRSVQAAALTLRVVPTYPQAAKAAGIEGVVTLEAVIGRDGAPESLQVMNPAADPDLARAAVEAVSQWRYRPTLLNGEPVEVLTKIGVTFTLQP